MENRMNEGMFLGDDLVTPQLLALLLSLRRPVLLTPETNGWRIKLGEPPPPVVPDVACVGLHELAAWLAANRPKE